MIILGRPFFLYLKVMNHKLDIVIEQIGPNDKSRVAWG